ncbi:sensor histidine kinase [Rhodococcus sp. NPDC058514]|uniref:sensor histidine kinase n=1 Tax=unclassified Rhodococcus (in: high G+C Gram-positive bacteria) TaxID=192944 RepID=UPI003651C400
MSRFPLSERWYQWSAEHVVGIDRTIAGLLALLGVAASVGVGWDDVVIALGLTVPLAWRRIRPVAAAAVVALFSVAYLIITSDQTNLVLPGICVPIALYALAAYGPRWASGWGLASAIVGVTVAGFRYFGGEQSTWQAHAFLIAFLIVYVAAVWAFGDLRRVRNQEVEGLTERARLLELERAQEAEIAAINERTRIAREMHDIVAHSLTVVIAQADGGRYSAKSDPEAAISALETISQTGRQALTDMRALLSVLREDRPREYSSTPGVSDIDSLIEEVGRGGLEVQHTAEGARRALSTGAELTAYRIVQESLTNVLKHAGPAARVQVTERWTDDVLELTVVDDGRGAAGALIEPTAGGQGVLGMRERAELYGGSFEAGPSVGGGYRVHTALPYSRGA